MSNPTTNRTLPNSLQLTHSEISELESLTRAAISAMEFWKRTMHRRGITTPATKVLMMIPARNGADYRLEWHQKRLGPKAIRMGQEYRKTAFALEQQYHERLHRKNI